MNLLNQHEFWALGNLFRILHGWYQPMQLFVGFSSPAQASFFLDLHG